MTTGNGIFVKKNHLVEKSARVANKIKQLTVLGGEGDESFLEVFYRPPALYREMKKEDVGTNLT